MRRMMLLSVLVVGAAVGLAVGALTVLADKGGPGHGADHGVANGLQEEGGADGVEAQDGENGNDGEGAKAAAEAIASTFSASQEDVLALHQEEGIGFGALFKLYVLAAAMDMSVGDLLDTIDKNGDGEYEFAFGERFKELTSEVSALSAGEAAIPKNLGQAKKGDKVAALEADDDGDGGGGPPDHAPAHGWRR